MKRQKTVRELRQEIMTSEALRGRPQEQLSAELKLNQATVSRILRGRFKRRSPAVDRVCDYAKISRITTQPLTEWEASLDRLQHIAKGGSAGERRALKLIRLAAEMIEADATAKSES